MHLNFGIEAFVVCHVYSINMPRGRLHDARTAMATQGSGLVFHTREDTEKSEDIST